MMTPLYKPTTICVDLSIGGNTLITLAISFAHKMNILIMPVALQQSPTTLQNLLLIQNKLYTMT